MLKENLISFPKLGLEMAVKTGFVVPGTEIEIRWYAVIIAIGFVLGVLYAIRRAKKVGLSEDTVLDLAILGMPLAIVFARVFYVLGDFEAYRDNFRDVFAIWKGGISILGALIGCMLTGVIYSLVKKVHLGRICDLAAPSLMIGQIIGRWGNFVNGEVYGVATDLPWGMMIAGKTAAPVHPLFLYESLWMLLGFVLLVLYQDKKRRHGEVFCIYILWYCAARAVMELMRDREFVLGSGDVYMSFWTVILFAFAALTVLVVLYVKGKKVNLRKDVLGAQVEEKRKVLDALLDKEAGEAEVLAASQELDAVIAEYMKL